MTRESKILLPGTEDFSRSLPQTSFELFDAVSGDQYNKTLEQLILLQNEGVTHFLGGPLDLAPHQRVWLSPVDVHTEEGSSYFQILYVNTTPDEALGTGDIPVSLLEIDETSYKLAPSEHPAYRHLARQFDTNEKQIIIRHCNTGMAYFPNPSVPSDASLMDEHLESLINVTGFLEPEVKIGFSKPLGEIKDFKNSNDIEIVSSRVYQFGGGTVNLYGAVLDNDPWKYYEIFAPGELTDIWGDNLLVRIDSGCDIGQIYDDRGCDCREQLHSALETIQEIGNGVIIHIPSQDGRGFGMATKMETEGIKRGVRVATNKRKLEEVDTITAARLLLGDRFDIRTYQGAGRILGSLGVSSVLLQTDNRLKLEGLEAANIVVRRKPTLTQGLNGSQGHVAAKHKFDDIYFGHSDEGHHEHVS